MARPDREKKQRITGFDFSSPEAHIAIVDKGANGVEGFTVLKSFSAKEEVEPETLENKESSESVSKESEATQEIHSDASSGAACDKEADVSCPPENINDGGHSMTDVIAPEQSEDVTKALDTVKAENEKLEARIKAQDEKLVQLEKAEEARVAASFEKTAKAYAPLGDVSALGPVLQALSTIDSEGVVKALLDSAMTNLDSSELFKTVGGDGDTIAPADHQLAQKATEIRIANPELTEAQAAVKALELNPLLAEEGAK